MFIYEKKLQYPVKIANCNPKLASFIISQYGGPDGELGASLRYLSQRYTMPYPELKALLTDIGVEELGHLEMVGTIVHQLTRSMTEQEVKDAGYEAYFVDHTAGVYPTAASGFPWNAASMAVKGDLIADLTEDLAADAASAKNNFQNRYTIITDDAFEIDFVFLLTLTLSLSKRPHHSGVAFCLLYKICAVLICAVLHMDTCMRVHRENLMG